MVDSLAIFARLINGVTPQPELVKVAFQRLTVQGKTSVDLKDLQNAAMEIGLPLQLSLMPLTKIQQRGGMALLQLSGPKEFVDLAASGTQDSLIYEHGMAQVIDNATLNKRYKGAALLLASSGDGNSSLRVKDPVRTAETSAVGGSSEIVENIPISNNGQHDISLAVESTSCGCTGAELSFNSLSPGQTGVIVVKMHPNSEVSQVETVTIHTDDPFWPRLIVALRTKLPAQRIARPAPLILSAERGIVTRHSLNLILPAEVSVGDITSQHHFITAKVLGVEPRTDSAIRHIEITVGADAPSGAFTDELTVELKGSEIKRILIPLSGFVNSDVKLEPQMINLGTVSKGSILKRTVTVQAPVGQMCTIKSVTCKNAHIKIQAPINMVAVRQQIELEITIADDVSPLRQDRITLLLADGRELSIDIFSMAEDSSKPVPEARE